MPDDKCKDCELQRCARALLKALSGNYPESTDPSVVEGNLRPFYVAMQPWKAIRELRSALKQSDVVGTPRLCPGCRSRDGEHTFGETCTLQEEANEQWDIEKKMPTDGSK